MKETKRRSIIKAVTYRSLATIATFTLAYLFTGDLKIASSIGVLDFGVKFAIYYFNERIWTFVGWGYRVPAEAITKPEEITKKEKHVKNSQPAPAKGY